MASVESIERGLENEDAAVKRQMDADHEAIYGGEEPPNDTAESDSVADKYMAGGNIVINQAPMQQVTEPEPEEPEAEAKPPEPPPAPADTAQKKSKLWPLVIGASILGGGAGAGLGYIINDLFGPRPTANDTDTITEMYFPGIHGTD